VWKEEREARRRLSSSLVYRHGGIASLIGWVVILLIILGSAWACTYLEGLHPLLFGGATFLVAVALLALWVVFVWWLCEE